MDKYYYKIYGLTLESDYEFPQFVGIDPVDEADIHIVYGNIPQDIYDYVEKGYYTADGHKEKWFVNRTGIFWIHGNDTINFAAHEGQSVDDAAQYLPGMALSILLWFREMIMIHGACLRYKGKTVVVSGYSGAGKSSITTELIKRGALLIADDVTGIQEENGVYYSYPAFPAQKLCKDQVEKNNMDAESLKQIRYDLNKYEIPRNDIFFNEKSEVDNFFLVDLASPNGQKLDRINVEKIDGAEKIKAVTDMIFIKWMFKEQFPFTPADMMRCLGFAKDLNIHKITRNREKDTLQEIVDYIDKTVSEEK